MGRSLFMCLWVVSQGHKPIMGRSQLICTGGSLMVTVQYSNDYKDNKNEALHTKYIFRTDVPHGGPAFHAADTVMMPVTSSKNTSKQVDMATGEGTSKSPTILANQSEAPAEHVLETSSTPKEIRVRRTISPKPLINAADQDLRNAVQLLTRIVAGQAQGQAIPTTGPNGTDREASLRTQDFLKMDPPTFTGSYLNKDPQDFIDHIQRALDVMHITATWKEFNEAFLDHYLPFEIRQARADQFLNLRQGNMSMREYSLQFNSLSRYAPNVVATMDERVHQYMDRLDPYLVRDYTIAALNKDMDIARIQAFTQKMEDQRQRRRTQELERGYSKRARSTGQFMAS
ncbi:hypothetical protein FXO38_36463 [Capsicum annuum]|nr:hypothetical protein FXO38_36463 [Capsicum annuum]